MNRVRVAVLADMLEERWPSMDLVADMLVEEFGTTLSGTVDATLVRPSMRRRFSALPTIFLMRQRSTADRLANRLWDYPRRLRKPGRDFDIHHVVDHSYANLIRGFTATPSVVTCHDIDAFRCLMSGSSEPRSLAFRKMAAHILEGLQGADRVICVSGTTRDELLSERWVDPARLVVIPNGVHPSCRPDPDPRSDDDAAAFLGPRGQTVDLLHVGSTVSRKRIDVLLEVFAEVRRSNPTARLVRVGGEFTSEQRRRVEDLGLGSFIVVLPSLSRRVLAAVYRRADILLQPSQREGFGLPVIEALASGLAVLASDLPVFREVGGSAVEYAPVGDVPAWARAVESLILERASDDAAWEGRRAAGLSHAASYSWAENARRTAEVYQEILA